MSHIGDQPPLASVIIPMRNEAARVAAQLEALARQDREVAWELIVVDNGSTDGSIEVVRRMAEHFPSMCLVEAPDARNQAQARNRGAAHARGQLLLHTDADDVVSDGWLAALVEGLDHHDLVTGPIEVTRLNAPGTYAWRASSHDGLLGDGGPLPFASTANLGIRREVFDVIGGFDDNLRRSADVDLSWRAQLAGYRLGLAPDALVHRRLRDTAGELFRQHYGYGEAGAALHRKYRHLGAPRPPLREALHEWGYLLMRAPRARRASDRRTWAVVAGRRVGRIAGSARHRVLYL